MQRLPKRKESHQNHGGVEPCSGHLDTCCKVSFPTTDPPSLKSRISTKSAESRRLRGNMMEASMTSTCPFVPPCFGVSRRQHAEYESLGKAEQKMPAYAPLLLAGLSEFSLCSRVLYVRRLWLLACAPVFCDGHVFVASSKDERVETPRWDGRCRKRMADRLDCMSALVTAVWRVDNNTQSWV